MTSCLKTAEHQQHRAESPEDPCHLQVETPDDSAELRRELVLAPPHDLDLWMSTGGYLHDGPDMSKLEIIEFWRFCQEMIHDLSARQKWII